MVKILWCTTASEPSRRFPIFVLILVAACANGVLSAQSNYYGKYIGKLKSLHHGVTGEVYAVDARTLHIRDFNYDGEGPAAYFYAGDSKSPNGFGFRINDEKGTPNVLSRYRRKHITLTLPDNKTLRDIKWFSVWCDEFSVNFGDVRIPKNLDYPKPQKIDGLKGVHAVSSEEIVVVDAQTLLIPSFSYDGEAPDAKFWVGAGSKPSPQGARVPDENGKEDPLRRYDRKTIVLTLPKDMTVFDVGHFGVWCEAFTVDFGHVRIPRSLNVPPSLKMLGVSPQKRPRSLHEFQALEQQLVQPNTFSGGVVADARSNFPRGFNNFNEQINPSLDTYYQDEFVPHRDDTRYTQQIRATTYKPALSHRRLSAQRTAVTDDPTYQLIPSISISPDSSQQQPQTFNPGYNTQIGQTQQFDGGFVDSSSSNLNPSQNYYSNTESFNNGQIQNDYYRNQPAQRRQDNILERQAQISNDYYRQQQAQRRRDSIANRQYQISDDYYNEQRRYDNIQRTDGRFGRNNADRVPY